ncbi:glycerate kinase isoform X1 [Sarcophilus harrisii]|uniref:Glycerate kinase n=1 Tax=Sarcophilus harrisii TaxID=9305 RepID=G3VCP4_SARHA|nr:glycerate kinase isoform X1 [Sarcophilus harrisii]XP_023354550.1 glycerate kinase isoform X1 [Sarcophilus harrisii]XP_023354551.1 glycerate kinase isoform X1 [Sarcophilus harrisii]XP_023354552.1 glycerate kinase isoform X1 [Sarcophilus harrisii]XP_023354553.1 glycerate kinase isoform X1 [Sarcophilus harrisii]XP_023354554.1 glycerate kinase isoform X1 [Sarcophilus harrisii]XP_031813960.1 glycerate kinase isoform X1 [Sarcophilus harrisii]
MASTLRVLPGFARTRPVLWGSPASWSSSSMTLAEQAWQLFECAVGAVMPGPMIRRVLTVDTETGQMKVRDRNFQLHHNVYLAGFGKAVLGMAAVAEELLSDHLVQGVISVPKGIQAAMESAGLNLEMRVGRCQERKVPPVWDPMVPLFREMLLMPHSHIQVFEGAKNNLPDRDSLQAAVAIQDMAEGLSADDLLLVLISGGGSALLPAPIPPVTLEEKHLLTKMLAVRGATIQELNTIRKALSHLKGGGLARAAYPAQVVSLILSDVVGDPLDVIASGPTVASDHNVQDCLHILTRYDLRGTLPRSVKTVLSRADSDPRGPPCCGHVLNTIIGSNSVALAEAQRRAEALGYQALILSTVVQGEVGCLARFYGLLAQVAILHLSSRVGTTKKEEEELQKLAEELQLTDLKLGDVLKTLEEAKGPVCLLAGGEPVVKVQGLGKGGRNQELALRVGVEMSGCIGSNWEALFLSGGTDGQDGPTEAAGAWVTPGLSTEAESEGLDVATFLANSDSNTFFQRLQGGIHLLNTGLTGTNVMDVHLMLLRPC